MNEQAETKLSTAMPVSERGRARRFAWAANTALRFKAAVTAGERRGTDARLAADGGGVTAVSRSAKRAMAAPPADLSTGAGAVAMSSNNMMPLCLIFRHHSQPPALRGFFPSPRLNG